MGNTGKCGNHSVGPSAARPGKNRTDRPGRCARRSWAAADRAAMPWCSTRHQCRRGDQSGGERCLDRITAAQREFVGQWRTRLRDRYRGPRLRLACGAVASGGARIAKLAACGRRRTGDSWFRAGGRRRSCAAGSDGCRGHCGRNASVPTCFSAPFLITFARSLSG